MHTYASVADAKRYATDEGIAWGEGSTNDALALGILESASRRVDGFCRRGPSGFGPRIGTNRYDAEGGTTLDFGDDLLTTTAVTFRDGTASAVTSTPAANTDYYLVNQQGSYDSGPYRRAILHGQGTITRLPSGLRVIDWAGTWGERDERRTLTAVVDAALNDSATSVAISAVAEFSPGMTIRVGTEQMYVELVDADVSQDTLTVVRAVNGTTIAAHADCAPISRYVYHPAVVEATLRIWFKRWGARNAGADGTDGGGEVGVTVGRESEDTILRRTLGPQGANLRLMGAVVFG